jgi:serine/threonine protein kinase
VNMYTHDVHPIRNDVAFDDVRPNLGIAAMVTPDRRIDSIPRVSSEHFAVYSSDDEPTLRVRASADLSDGALGIAQFGSRSGLDRSQTDLLGGSQQQPPAVPLVPQLYGGCDAVLRFEAERSNERGPSPRFQPREPSPVFARGASSWTMRAFDLSSVNALSNSISDYLHDVFESQDKWSLSRAVAIRGLRFAAACEALRRYLNRVVDLPSGGANEMGNRSRSHAGGGSSYGSAIKNTDTVDYQALFLEMQLFALLVVPYVLDESVVVLTSSVAQGALLTVAQRFAALVDGSARDVQILLADFVGVADAWHSKRIDSHCRRLEIVSGQTWVYGGVIAFSSLQLLKFSSAAHDDSDAARRWLHGLSLLSGVALRELTPTCLVADAGPIAAWPAPGVMHSFLHIDNVQVKDAWGHLNSNLVHSQMLSNASTPRLVQLASATCAAIAAGLAVAVCSLLSDVTALGLVCAAACLMILCTSASIVTASMLRNEKIWNPFRCEWRALCLAAAQAALASASTASRKRQPVFLSSSVHFASHDDAQRRGSQGEVSRRRSSVDGGTLELLSLVEVSREFGAMLFMHLPDDAMDLLVKEERRFRMDRLDGVLVPVSGTALWPEYSSTDNCCSVPQVDDVTGVDGQPASMIGAPAISRHFTRSSIVMLVLSNSGFVLHATETIRAVFPDATSSDMIDRRIGDLFALRFPTQDGAGDSAVRTDETMCQRLRSVVPASTLGFRVADNIELRNGHITPMLGLVRLDGSNVPSSPSASYGGLIRDTSRNPSLPLMGATLSFAVWHLAPTNDSFDHTPGGDASGTNLLKNPLANESALVRRLQKADAEPKITLNDLVTAKPVTLQESHRGAAAMVRGCATPPRSIGLGEDAVASSLLAREHLGMAQLAYAIVYTAANTSWNTAQRPDGRLTAAQTLCLQLWTLGVTVATVGAQGQDDSARAVNGRFIARLRLHLFATFAQYLAADQKSSRAVTPPVVFLPPDISPSEVHELASSFSRAFYVIMQRPNGEDAAVSPGLFASRDVQFSLGSPRTRDLSASGTEPASPHNNAAYPALRNVAYLRAYCSAHSLFGVLKAAREYYSLLSSEVDFELNANQEGFWGAVDLTATKPSVVLSAPIRPDSDLPPTALPARRSTGPLSGTASALPQSPATLGAGERLPIEQVFRQQALQSVREGHGLVRIGSGAFSTVFQIRAVPFNFDIVLKRIVLFSNSDDHDGAAFNDMQQYRDHLKQMRSSPFEYDYQHIMLLDHPNICRTYFALEYSEGQSTTTFLDIFQEFCNGGTLASRILSLIDPDSCYDIVKGVLFGLQHLQLNNIVHLDIKVENILVRDGVPKIADFGTARRLLYGKASGGPEKGTLEYMAPEIILNKDVTSAADIFSFGIVLCKMFGIRPETSLYSYEQLVSYYRNAPDAKPVTPRLGVVVNNEFVELKQAVSGEKYREIVELVNLIEHCLRINHLARLPAKRLLDLPIFADRTRFTNAAAIVLSSIEREADVNVGASALSFESRLMASTKSGPGRQSSANRVGVSGASHLVGVPRTPIGASALNRRPVTGTRVSPASILADPGNVTHDSPRFSPPSPQMPSERPRSLIADTASLTGYNPFGSDGGGLGLGLGLAADTPLANPVVPHGAPPGPVPFASLHEPTADVHQRRSHMSSDDENAPLDPMQRTQADD